jgi:predicted TIM-barrel fold metal-dependent hydrolase
MDIDGIQFEVMYPTLGLRLWRLPDPELLSAIHRAYNDWLAEFCRAYPDRFAGVGLVLLDDIDSGVAELRRIAGLGMCGGMITVHPGFEQSYDHPMYEPVWATAEELGLPLSLHIGTNRISSNSPNNGYDTKFLQHPTQYATASYWVQCSISDMIFAGVFEKHPGLKVVSLEHEAAWAPGLVQVMDYTYTQRARRESWHRFPDGNLPSDYFHGNVYISMQEDAVAVRLRDVIGVENLVWGDDFPHHESTFPKSREILGEILDGVPDSEQQMILHTNALALYDLPAR